MKENEIIATKTKTEDKIVTTYSKTFKNGKYDFFKEVVHYLDESGGRTRREEPEKISREDYLKVKSPEITYNNHP